MAAASMKVRSNSRDNSPERMVEKFNQMLKRHPVLEGEIELQLDDDGNPTFDHKNWYMLLVNDDSSIEVLDALQQALAQCGIRARTEK